MLGLLEELRGSPEKKQESLSFSISNVVVADSLLEGVMNENKKNTMMFMYNI